MEKQDIPKTLGQAIDAIIEALKSLDDTSQATAIRAACDHLKIKPPETIAMGHARPGGTPPPEGASGTPTRSADIRALKQEKQPSTANEMAALVAFYLSELVPEAERKTQVQQEDMVKYFKEAKYPLPKQPRFLLTNAKNSGYFDFLGDGKFRLNAVGYNLVAHNLPREKPSGAPAPQRKRRKGSSVQGRKKSKK